MEGMSISTGGAMPNLDVLRHASSDDLMKAATLALKIVGERNGYTLEEMLNILQSDEVNASHGT
jgi:hypothetical protein